MSAELCACRGAINSEPYCPCIMVDKGLKTSADYDISAKESIELKRALAKAFGWYQPHGS